MTEPASATSTQPTVSFWEDVIDIFISPVAVFRRRENSSVWPPLLFVSFSIGIILFATFNTIEPIFEAEFRRNMAAQMAANPNIKPEMMESLLSRVETGAKYAGTLGAMFTVFMLGVLAWIVGKLFGSKATFNGALVITAWSYMPRVLDSALRSAEGLLMDPAKMNSQLSISFSPARFMDVETANPVLYQFLGRFDLITIWVTVLLGIGMCVVGKISKGRAAGFAFTMWVLGSLYFIRQGYLQP